MADMAPLAQAYVASLDANVVVPIGAVKCSEVYPMVRAVFEHLPIAMKAGPLIVHGLHTGSIPAVQAAAERSQDDADAPVCRALVLENGVDCVSAIPGAVGVFGGVQNDPFSQLAKLRLVRCPVILVRGSREEVPFAQSDPMDALAGSCITAPARIDEGASFVEGAELYPSLTTALRQALCVPR